MGEKTLLFFLLVLPPARRESEAQKRREIFHFFLIFGVSFSTKNKRETLLLFSSQSPNNKKNNNKKGLFGLFSFARRSETRAAAEEKIETTMTRCVVYSCFDEISFVSFCTMLFRYFNAFPSKFLKIKLTILNLLFSQQWRTGDASPGGRFTTTALSFLLSKE